MHFYVWCTILGMLCTLVAFWIYALFNDFSYIGILTLQVDSWKKIEYIKSSDGGIIFLAILGACSVMMGLFGIMRKGILVLLNNIFSNKMDAGNYYEKEWDVHDELDSKRATSDDLRRAIMKKLWQPGYKQEVISKYKSNLIKFRFGTLLVMALGILIGLFGSYFSKEIWALSCCVALIVFAVLYLYLAKKYYKCPACGFELNIGWFAYQDGRSDPNFSNLESCPQCAAPFH